MAIAWDQIVPILEQQIRDASELPDENIRWVDKKGGTLGGAFPVLWLRIVSITDPGAYEEREERYETHDAADQSVMVSESRSFTLSVRCESNVADITDPLHPANIVDRIKIRMGRRSYCDARAGTFSVYNDTPTKWFTYLADDVPVFVYTFDFFCGTVNIDQDLSENAGAWIGEVQYTVTVKETDGSTVEVITEDVDARNT